MTLPAPNLDDRRFQDLVDDAKRLVQQRCPEWTDHNVSDPGVTLIEAFAFAVDQLLYRLNRVPDRNYVKFLDLLGVHLFPPTAARADVTFWLSTSLEERVTVPVGTEVATSGAGGQEPVVFTVTQPRDIVPCHLETAMTHDAGADSPIDRSEELVGERSFPAFSTPPAPGDTLLVGLSDPVPGCAVALTIDAHIEGVGVDPDDPPIVWEAWDGTGWSRCDVDRDTTGGLNRAGEVVVHVPPTHTVSVVLGRRAGWLRGRVVEAREDQPFYSAPPQVDALAAATVGGTTEAVHARLIDDETLGLSEGVAGQRFRLRHRPVVPGSEPFAVEVATGSGWEPWTEVDTFADSGPDDHHVVLDATAGEVTFGPAVRQPDGTLRAYGAVPPKGAPIRVPAYRTGGGRIGNVARGALSTLTSTLSFVDRIENRRPATGGVDGEDIESAKVRGPITLRTRNRAVTLEDYEVLAKEGAPEVARVRAVAAGDGADANGVRVLVVPAVGPDDETGTLRFEQLVLPDETLANIAAHLDTRRCVGARVVVEPPSYVGVTVVARVRAKPNVRADLLRNQAVAALNTYFDPLRGGPDGNGWPFGRPVHVGEVYSVLQRLDGTEFVEDARVFPADPITGERGEAAQRIDLPAHSLVFSYGHQVRIER